MLQQYKSDTLSNDVFDTFHITVKQGLGLTTKSTFALSLLGKQLWMEEGLEGVFYVPVR